MPFVPGSYFWGTITSAHLSAAHCAAAAALVFGEVSHAVSDHAA